MVLKADELPLIVFKAFAYAIGGRSMAARNYMLAIDRCGGRVKLKPVGHLRNDELPDLVDAAELRRLEELEATPFQEPYVVIHDVDVGSLKREPGAALNIAYAVFETDRCPSEWIPVLNQMDDVWVPSSFVAEAFSRSGIPEEKLFVVPHGVDASTFQIPSSRPDDDGSRVFNFVSLFAWEPRKAPEILLAAYLREFGGDEKVSLTIRALTRLEIGPAQDLFQEMKEDLTRKLGISQAPPIHLDTRALISDSELAKFYASGDAFVLATRGEGWGLPLAEAMACGLPVIVTNWGGHLDFVNDENGYLVDFNLVPVRVLEGRYTNQGGEQHLWAEPSIHHLRTLMRRVFEDRAEARNKGMLAAGEIAKLSWEAAAERMLNRLRLRIC